MGGSIAQELVLRHPDKVAGLILRSAHCGLPHRIPPPPEMQSLFAPDAAVGLDPREAARRGWAVGYTPEFIAANRDLLETLLDRSLAHPTPAATRTRQSEAIQACSSYERLGQLAAPTLIITGDRDVAVVPENARILHERIAGSRLHVIKDAAHSCHVSHPEEMVRVVTEFLYSCGAATRE
jgi:pimeloyl-ACP methyl ester carboxylesterase